MDIIVTAIGFNAEAGELPTLVLNITGVDKRKSVAEKLSSVSTFFCGGRFDLKYDGTSNSLVFERRTS